MLELITVSFKHKIAQTFFLSLNLPATLNLVVAICIAVFEQHTLTAVSFSVYPSPCKVTICALLTSVKDVFLPNV